MLSGAPGHNDSRHHHWLRVWNEVWKSKPGQESNQAVNSINARDEEQPRDAGDLREETAQ